MEVYNLVPSNSANFEQVFVGPTSLIKTSKNQLADKRISMRVLFDAGVCNGYPSGMEV